MMTGVGDAISKKFARQVLVLVSENADDEDQATEVFAVTLAYTEKDCLLMTE
jgi:hypothetical protein